MRTVFAASVAITLLLVGSQSLLGVQTTAGARPTDTMTAEQFRKAGLQKLSPVELDALNEWLSSKLSRTSNAPGPDSCERDSNDEITLYDKHGSAVAYISLNEDSTVYLWSGKPVAYLDKEHVYGFNGKHLGWFQDGYIYDHEGHVAATTCEAATSPLKPAPFKSFKQFKPFKAFEEFAPFEPFRSTTWSQLPTGAFLFQGAK